MNYRRCEGTRAPAAAAHSAQMQKYFFSCKQICVMNYKVLRGGAGPRSCSSEQQNGERVALLKGPGCAAKAVRQGHPHDCWACNVACVEARPPPRAAFLPPQLRHAVSDCPGRRACHCLPALSPAGWARGARPLPRQFGLQVQSPAVAMPLEVTGRRTSGRVEGAFTFLEPKSYRAREFRRAKREQGPEIFGRAEGGRPAEGGAEDGAPGASAARRIGNPGYMFRTSPGHSRTFPDMCMLVMFNENDQKNGHTRVHFFGFFVKNDGHTYIQQCPGMSGKCPGPIYSLRVTNRFSRIFRAVWLTVFRGHRGRDG